MIKSQSPKAIFLFFSLIGFSLFATAKQDQEESFCQEMKSIYLEANIKHKEYVNEQATLLIKQQNEQPNYLLYRAMASVTDEEAINNGIILWEKLTETTAKNDFIYTVSSYWLAILYANKKDSENALYWFLNSALPPYKSLQQYELSLYHSKICEEELKEMQEEIRSQNQQDLQELESEDLVRKIKTNALDPLIKMDNFSKDYIQAYYWANLAAQNNYPSALQLKKLIAEKMSPEEIQTALNFVYKKPEHEIKEQDSDTENLICQNLTDLYLEETNEYYSSLVVKTNAFSKGNKDSLNYRLFTNVMLSLHQGAINNGTILLEKMVSSTEDPDDFLNLFALKFLTVLYFNKADPTKTLYWLNQGALPPSKALHQYDFALSYAHICIEELKSAHLEVHAFLQDQKDNIQRGVHPTINVHDAPYFFNDAYSSPVNYVMAYYWANLATLNRFPFAIELRELIIERMNPEEIEQAIIRSH